MDDDAPAADAPDALYLAFELARHHVDPAAVPPDELAAMLAEMGGGASDHPTPDAEPPE